MEDAQELVTRSWNELPSEEFQVVMAKFILTWPKDFISRPEWQTEYDAYVANILENKTLNWPETFYAQHKPQSAPETIKSLFKETLPIVKEYKNFPAARPGGIGPEPTNEFAMIAGKINVFDEVLGATESECTIL